MSDNLEDNIRQIKQERVNDAGEEVWYHSMIDYLKNSPYGKAHQYSTFEDLIQYFKSRTMLEDRIVAQLLPGKCINLQSKRYELEVLCKEIENNLS